MKYLTNHLILHTTKIIAYCLQTDDGLQTFLLDLITDTNVKKLHFCYRMGCIIIYEHFNSNIPKAFKLLITYPNQGISNYFQRDFVVDLHAPKIELKPVL